MLTVVLLVAFTLLCVLLSADRAWDNVTKPERNALVFDGRHRSYGAFVLRREYERRFVWAFFGALGLFGAAVAVPKVLGAMGLWTVPSGPLVPPIPTEHVLDYFLPETPTPQPSEPTRAATPAAAPSRQDVFVTPTDSVIPVDKDTASVVVDPGPPNPGPVGPVGPGVSPGPGPGSTGEDGPGKFTIDSPGNPGIVDEVPEFPGGHAAMARFIQDNLRITNEDITQAKEQVIFVIDTDGSVVRVKSRGRSAKDFCDAAERVVRLMPKWKPARYKGRDVPCVMVLPIEYQTR